MSPDIYYNTVKLLIPPLQPCCWKPPGANNLEPPDWDQVASSSVLYILFASLGYMLISVPNGYRDNGLMEFKG